MILQETKVIHLTQLIQWDDFEDGITNSMDMNLGELQEMMRNRETWHAIVYGVPKSQTRLSDWTTHNDNSMRICCTLNNCVMETINGIEVQRNTGQHGETEEWAPCSVKGLTENPWGSLGHVASVTADGLCH